MFKFKMKQLLFGKCMDKPHVWMGENIGISTITASKMINNKLGSIRIEDLAKICVVLNCTPNDLFYWENDEVNQLPDTHACITKLNPPTIDSTFQELLDTLNYQQVMELYQEAEKMIKEMALEKSKEQG